MNRTKRSKVWKVAKADLEVIVRESVTLSQICDKLQISRGGGPKRALLQRLQEDEIDISHIPRGYANNTAIYGRSGPKKLIPLAEMLVENSPHSRRNLKKRLIKEGLLTHSCALCHQGPEWNGKPLVLALDHENGINNDNRLSNLRLLCPNCHSQTDTFAGRNSRRRKVENFNPIPEK